MKIDKKAYRTSPIDYILVSLILLLLIPFFQNIMTLNLNDSMQSVSAQTSSNRDNTVLGQQLFHDKHLSGDDRPALSGRSQKTAR